MKAIILAGGPGTRLRPLTCTRPKLLMPIANRALLDWTFERLSWAGVSEAVLTLNYMAEAFRKYFGEEKYGVRVKYVVEPRAMGTGGPVKLSEKLLKLEADEVFLVMNGDIWCDLDFSALEAAHKHNISKGAVMTITLYEVKDVSRFGVVELKPDGRITAFHEKPSGRVKSKLINAGIYASTSQIFSYIEPRRTSIEREVFPKLALEGRLYSFHHKGEWDDVGKIEDYLKVNFRVAEVLAGERPRVEGSAEYDSTVKLTPPVILGDGVRLNSDSRIGPNAILGCNVKVGEGCQISNSVIFNGVEMEDRCLVKGSILGEGVLVGKEAKITGGSVIGDLSIIAPKVKLSRKVYVCPRKEIDRPILGPRRIP